MSADIYHDAAHARLRYLAKARPGVAEFIKTAEFEDSGEALPDTAFAWPARRLYPIHTPEHAVVSKLYLDANPQAPTYAKLAMEEALKAYGVPTTVFTPVQEKTASDPGQFLFPHLRTYPVRSAAEVKTAEDRLLEQLRASPKLLPLEERTRVFNKLAAAAEEHGVTLNPQSQAWGLWALSDPVTVLDGLTARAHLAKHAEEREAYLETARAFRQNPRSLRDHGTRQKLATVLYELDKRAGLVELYGKRLNDPFETVFNHAVKQGAQLVDLGGDAYSLDVLMGLPATFWRDALGPEFVSEIAPGGQVSPETLAAVLPTLPAPMMAPLAQALRSAGVRPEGV